jgi:hypothetical protein
MKKYIVKAKQSLRHLLLPKAVLIGVTVLNFMMVYLQAKEAEEAPGIKFCFGAPWYLTAPWENFPLLLLLAAVTLYLGRWWAYLTAVALCAPVVYQALVDTWRALMIESGWDWMWYGLPLQFQYVLAATLTGIAVISLAREVRR